MEPQSPSKKEGMETRNRSRSRTPSLQLRVSVERDVNGDSKPDKVQKNPNVATIEEELNSSQKSASGAGGSRSVRKTRTVTSDYSSDGVSPERPATKEASSLETEESITVSKTTISVTTSSSSTASASLLTKVAASSNAASPSKKEIRQNEINRTLEDTQKAVLRTSTPKATSKVAKKKVTLTPEELKQHVAYKEYKEAGEYWNKYPKTDYTYSELSPFRRELAAGMIAMPNMSRPGLNKHAERISVMIERNPTQETYIRQRYANISTYSTSGVAGGSFARADPYDSGEETLDLSQLSRSSRSYRSKRSTAHVQVEEHRSMVSRFFLTIVNWFYSTTHSVSRIFNQSDHNLYYTRIEDERGFLSKIYHFFNMLVTSVFKKVYLLISSVLFLDTWLLQTASSDVQQGRRKRKFLLFLLILLPFLLFGGIYLYLDPTPLQSFRENLANPLLNYDLKLDLPDTEAAKAFALEKWDSARHFTEYYFDSMKLASQNTVEEIRKIWQENVNHLFN